MIFINKYTHISQTTNSLIRSIKILIKKLMSAEDDCVEEHLFLILRSKTEQSESLRKVYFLLFCLDN